MHKTERERVWRAEAERRQRDGGSEKFRKVPRAIFSKFQPETFFE